MPLNVLPISQRTADQPSAAVVTRPTSHESSKFTPPPKVPPKHQDTEAKFDHQRQIEKEKGQCSIRREQHKPEKDSVQQDEEKAKKKKKKNKLRNRNGRIKESL